MDEPQIPIDPGVDLARLLGQRRAFAAVGGRCSAAHAQLLRRIRDEKLYRAIAPSWRRFCGTPHGPLRLEPAYVIKSRSCLPWNAPASSSGD